MGKKLCRLMSVVLALSICIPGGALQAVADEGAGAQSTASQGSVSSEGQDAEGLAGQTNSPDEGAPQGTAQEGASQEPPAAEGGQATTPDDAAIPDGEGSQADAAEASPDEATAPDSPEPAAAAPLRAPGAPKQVDTTITNLTIQNLAGETSNTVWITDTFYLAMDWDASANGADLHEGDYFDVTLPNNMWFPSNTTASDFDLYAPDGVTVIAHAHVTSGPGDKGGTARVTFTDWVEGKQDVKGSLRLASKFDQAQVTVGQDNTFDVAVSGQVSSVTVGVTGPTELHDEILSKWSTTIEGAPDQARWTLRINHMKATLTNAVITDHLSEGAGNETYIPDSFELYRVEMDSVGNVTQTFEQVPVAGKLTIAPDNRSFTLNLGNVNGEQYRLYYKTTYTPGTTLRNNAKLESAEKTKTYTATHISANSGGSGSGNLANKIKLTKVAADDNTVVLAGAVFEVTRPDGSTFELTTGADGTVTSGFLTSGTYTVREKVSPSGYELSDQEYTLVVSSTGGALQTITDEPVKISISVTKAWVGPEGGDVTVHLLADTVDTGKTLTLTAAGSWTGSFDGLRQYATDGHEIVYTVEEDPVANYDAAVTGDAAGGFTITNTSTETVSVPVAKTWVGPKGTEVTVKLLSDGVEVPGKTVALNEGNGWTGNFDGLAKYAADGHEIAYTVTEAEVSGVDGSEYDTVVTGDAASGFTITNTNVETTSIAGTKTWDDDNDRDGARPENITVNLVGDGTPTGDSKTVTAGDNWSWEFGNLAKYAADGHEIVYTVTEDAVPNYATTIDGTNVTNSYTPGRTSVTATKAWDDANDQDGIRPDSIQLQLYANGAPSGDPVTLSADNQWTHTWTNLFQKEGGQDIAYTVAEVGVPSGYEVTVAGDAASGFTVTNAHVPETVSIPVTKKWVGGKGGSVTIHLLADGVDTGKTLTLDASGNWMGSFSDLPKYRDGGTEIAYSIKEDAVDGYTAKVSGDAASGFVVTNTKGKTPPASGGGGKAGTPSSGLSKTGDSMVAPVAFLAAALISGLTVLLARRRSTDRRLLSCARHSRR